MASILFACTLLVSGAGAARADDLAVPRYVSTRHGDINVRVGPGKRYPVTWIFVRQNLPLEITQEFENWRKVKDSEGAEGWVTSAALQGRRFVLVEGATRPLRRDPADQSAVAAWAEAGVIGSLLKCPTTPSDWCQVQLGGLSGWLRRTELWGVLPDEIYPAP